MTAEADMWAAAVEQAFRAGCVSRVPGKNDMGAATALEAANEWRFLTAATGPWAESRNRICSMCGIEPEVVRQEALRRGPSRHALAGLRSERDGDRQDREMKTRFGNNPSPEKMARNRALGADFANGVPVPELAQKYGLSAKSIGSISRAIGARRPAWFLREAARRGGLAKKKAASNASGGVLGGACVAGGGGVGGSSFHEVNPTQGAQT